MAPLIPRAVRERALILALTVGMALIALGVGAIYGAILYRESLDQYRLQLTELVRMQANLVEQSVVAERGPLTSEAIDQRTLMLERLSDGLLSDGRFGATGQLQVVELIGDSIHFIFPESPAIHVGASVGDPAREAVRGVRGTLFGADFRGERVLAATEFVPSLGVGMVAKVDLAEFRGPFLRASLLAGLLVLLLVGIASALYLRIAQPYVQAHEESSYLHAIAERDRRYRELVESSGDLFFAFDTSGKWTFLTHASQSVYGLPPSELLGRSIAERVKREYLAKDTAALERILRGGTLVDHETVHRSVDGEDRILMVSAHPVTDLSGKITGGQGIARDVTSARALEENLRRAAQEARTAAEAKSAFLANMSHEIRTPMNGIMGMSQLLADTRLDEGQRRSVEIIQSSSEALLGVLDDILDLSKIEAGHLRIENIPLEIADVSESVLQILAPRAHAQNTELILDVSPKLPPWVEGDPHRLRQVLLNLAGNAVKFTKGGEVLLSVRGAGDAGAPRFRFSVKDTGIGIAPEKLEVIFEEFAQADSSITRTHGGTGLGLSLSRRLVRMMGGELGVESVEGEGSEFYFELPMLVVAAPEKVAPVPTADIRGAFILIVDDNQTNRRVFDGYLTYAGAEVIEADSLVAALALLERLYVEGRLPDATILDQAMPGGSGIELAERMKADLRFAAIPLLMLTSSARSEDGERARAAGIGRYLHKPIRREQVLAALSQLIGAREGLANGGANGGAGAAVGARASTPPVPAPGSAMAAGSADLTGSPSPSGSHRILLAEDNPVNQLVAVAMLQKQGYEVVAVENGAEALQKVLAERWDLVLMDIQMPVMDGIEATRRIRAEGVAVPILALTAHALEEERERTAEAGMDGFVSKPFRAETLFSEVDRFLK